MLVGTLPSYPRNIIVTHDATIYMERHPPLTWGIRHMKTEESDFDHKRIALLDADLVERSLENAMPRSI